MTPSSSTPRTGSPTLAARWARDVSPEIVQRRYAVAQAAAKEAGHILTARRTGGYRIELKGAVDLVTEVDRAAEAVLIAVIRDHFPDDPIQAEETGRHAGADSAWRWVIDPLDGTTNYVHGLDHFAVSVGLVWHDQPVVGVIDAPALGKRYHGALGRGAWLGDTPLTVSDCQVFDKALLATGFPYDRRADIEGLLGPLGRALASAQGVRRMGSAALDLAAIAEGVFDGYWEPRLKPWDVVAGILLANEAGAKVTDYAGVIQQGRGPQCDIVAAPARLHHTLLAMVTHAPD